MPLDPVTLIEAALVSFTVKVSDCPAEMVLELAVMETVGSDAAALLANKDIARNPERGTRDRRLFIGPAF